MTELEAIEHQHAVRLARWSAALGTLGLITAVFGIGVLLALMAIGCAVLALNHLATTRSDNARGIALVGLVAGVLALLVFPLLVATAVPRFFSAREKIHHERCYSNLRVVGRWKQIGLGQARSHPVDVSGSTSALPPELKCPAGGKYNFKEASPTRCSIPIHNQPPGRTEPPRRLRFS